MSGSSSSHQSMVPYNNYALNMDYSGTSYSYAPADTNAQYFYEPTSAYEPRQFSSQNTFMNEPLSAQGHSPPPPSRSVAAARGTTRSSHPHYAPYTHFPRRLPTASTSAAASSGAGIEDPMVKKKRKRADAHQLKVLNEVRDYLLFIFLDAANVGDKVYDRNPFPPTVEREALAVQLGMTPRSVQIWRVIAWNRRPLISDDLCRFQNKRQAARQGGRGGQSSKSGSGPSLEPAPATSGSSGNSRSAPVHHSSSLQIIEAPSAAAPRGAPGYVSSPQVRAQSVSPPRSAHRYPQQLQQQTIVVDPYDDRSRRTHAREDRTGSPSQPPVTRRRM
jgi:homeobox protein YOX1/YHP1